jgi:hypothetical protein
MLIFPCPQCGAKLQMSDDLAGKKVRCAGCQAVVTAPNTSEMIQSEPAAKPKASSSAVKSGAREAAERDDGADVRRRRPANNDAAVATAAAATGAGIGIMGILVAVFAGLFALGCCGAVLAALLVPAVQKVREAAARAQTINNMRQIALAEHNFHDTYKTLSPPKVLKPPQNQPVDLSWRVAMLPYIEQQALFTRFDTNSSWDSPANRPLLSPMPMIYDDVSRDSKPGTTDTRFQYFTGPGTVWPDANTNRRTLMEITAGTSNTILFAESANPVPWSKPADMAIQPGGPLPLPPDRFIAAFADGSVRIIDRRRAPDAVIRQYLDPKNNAAHPPID